VAFPINFQMALGSNLQVCISPNVLATLFAGGSGPAPTAPPIVNRFLGSGLGGNMQLTMGTSANFVIGQSFDINVGPRRITLDVHDQTGIQACVKAWGIVIVALSAAFLILYPAIPDDDGRAVWVMLFELAMQISILFLMDTEGIYHHMDGIYKMQLDTLYSADPVQATKDNKPDADAFGKTFTGESTLGGALAVVGVVAAGFLPVFLEIGGESRLDTPDPPEAVVDSSGNQIGTVKS
jgi:hypothetical protein